MSGRSAVWLRAWSLVLVALTLSACGGGSDGDGIIGTGFTIKGAAQKGPFVKGSRVSINPVTSDGKSAAGTTTTFTEDDLGQFSFPIEKAGLVQISVDGYSFNELTGNTSGGTLLLRGLFLAQEKNDQRAYVNVLTHITTNRVLN